MYLYRYIEKHYYYYYQYLIQDCRNLVNFYLLFSASTNFGLPDANIGNKGGVFTSSR